MLSPELPTEGQMKMSKKVTLTPAGDSDATFAIPMEIRPRR